MQTRLEKYNKYRQEIYQFNKLVDENKFLQQQINNYQEVINKINAHILDNWSDKKVDLFENPIDISKAKQHLPTTIYENIREVNKQQYEIVKKDKTDFFKYLEKNYLFNDDHSNISQDFLVKQPSYQKLMGFKEKKDSFETNYKDNNVEKKISENFGKGSFKNDLSVATFQATKLKTILKKNYFFSILIYFLIGIFVALFVLVVLFALQILK